MSNPKIEYLYNNVILSFKEFDLLNPKPKLPYVKHFGKLKNFVIKNTSKNNISQILIDLDKLKIIITIN